MPKDNDPRAAVGSTTHVADLVSVTVGAPEFDESVDVLLAVVPFWTTE